jgi:hypothetical protein
VCGIGLHGQATTLQFSATLWRSNSSGLQARAARKLPKTIAFLNHWSADPMVFSTAQFAVVAVLGLSANTLSADQDKPEFTPSRGALFRYRHHE